MEKDIQNYLRVKLKEKGCLVIKIMVSSIIGTPDLLIIDPVKGVYMIEVKSDTGQLSSAQILMIDRLRVHGMPVYVIKGMAEAKMWITCG
jgi:hypothetical protein